VRASSRLQPGVGDPGLAADLRFRNVHLYPTIHIPAASAIRAHTIRHGIGTECTIPASAAMRTSGKNGSCWQPGASHRAQHSQRFCLTPHVSILYFRQKRQLTRRSRLSAIGHGCASTRHFTHQLLSAHATSFSADTRRASEEFRIQAHSVYVRPVRSCPKMSAGCPPGVRPRRSERPSGSGAAEDTACTLFCGRGQSGPPSAATSGDTISAGPAQAVLCLVTSCLTNRIAQRED
jgi:hypothetical protein